MSIYLLDKNNNTFPDQSRALKNPNGLLAMGGNLSVDRLINAYKNGIFPWFNDGDPFLWWSPDPRGVLLVGDLHIGRSLKRVINKSEFQFKIDSAFDEVINQCAAPRGSDDSSWITKEMIAAYNDLHLAGFAHSIECWQGDKMVGGLYGVRIGKVFFAESMFRVVDNASKMAVYFLHDYMLETDGKLIDIQIMSPHLKSLGAIDINRDEFLDMVAKLVN